MKSRDDVTRGRGGVTKARCVFGEGNLRRRPLLIRVHNFRIKETRMPASSGRYDPPAFMTDFDDIPGQLEAWSNAMSGWVDEIIAQVEQQLAPGSPCQFYNLVTNPQPGPLLEQEVIWAAFPKMLRVLYGLPGAFELADDKLYPLSQSSDP